MNARKPYLLATFFLICACSALGQSRSAKRTSDGALVKMLPGFKNEYFNLNGIRLHVVSGGTGTPIILLPGWPETWWAYHKIMPGLAKEHRVISVDLRGMGSSDKPNDGYDKKTMASDISALVNHLGYGQVDVVGHDIGAMVAFSLAANHPDQVHRLVLLDNGHPSAGYNLLLLLPSAGTFGDKLDEAHPYFWWFAFHQVKGLPEDLLEGRAGIEQAWFFRYMLRNEAALDLHDRDVYAQAYSPRDAIRAGNGWYQAFPQDVLDDGTYKKIDMPVLGIGGAGYPRLKATLDAKATNAQLVKIPDCGHFLAEEKPVEVLAEINRFLQ